MTQPRENCIDGLHGMDCGRWRPPQHQHRNAQAARSSNLGIGRFAATVLGDDHIDGVRQQQLTFRLFREGTTVKQIIGKGDWQAWLDCVNASDEIAVLGCRTEGGDFLATDREEHTLGNRSQFSHALLGVGDFDPMVSWDGSPRRATQRDHRCMGQRGGIPRIDGYSRCIRMSGVDQGLNCMSSQVLREARNTAETASADRHRLNCRRGRAARQRYRHAQIAASRQARRQGPRPTRAAENQYGWLHVVR